MEVLYHIISISTVVVVKISSSNVEPPGAVGGNKKILKFYIYTHTRMYYIYTRI